MTMNLKAYQFPQCLKDMDVEQMELLSIGIRDFLIDKVSQTGGHLASNLGVVELTLALHHVFDSPTDKIIWDVGHQSYVHKILTGRIDEFDHLRQYGGMSGFPKKKESEHDVYETGHSSTSISAAAGMAAARDIKGDKHEVIAVIGDGSLTGGMAYEALNNIGASKEKVIVILNDNGMSISRNIGGVSQHLSKLRTSTGYAKAKLTAKHAIKRIPTFGERMYESIDLAKDRLKYAMMHGGVIFEELGFTYLGPIDGHNLHDVIEALHLAKTSPDPVLLHVITKKGKGYKNAEKEPNKFHGVGPFDPETGALKQSFGISYSKVFGQTCEELAETDQAIVAISAAMGDATGLGGFAEKFPKRFFDVGIAEAHGVTFAAGLASCGTKPVVAIYSSFLQRAYDQIIEDVCLQNLPVVFAIDRAGAVGADGETHHGVFDLSYLIPMPNMTILTPCDGTQLAGMLKYAVDCNSPVAIRYPRGGCDFHKEQVEVFDGKNHRLLEGHHVDIWACGRMVAVATEVAEKLAEKGISAGVVDVAIVKPLDLSPLGDGVNQNKVLVTLEDNLLAGGFGESFTAATGAANVMRFGWPDKFVEHGDCDTLYKQYGLDADSIVERICERIERKA
ncbi:MAG: 1-deoxy-D-xylulose-5-phosphate synthase [Firmicutes bacterium]|nr:1-deoxy-D-xylulose-5-phosphate synthase [Bacillota bacterium]